MHLYRTEPLGPHSTGLVYLLRMRGDGQFFNAQSFSLWRIAHHRLQARQILLRERPQPEQEVWINKLNDQQPDLHITMHVFQISKLCADAQEMINDPSKSTEPFVRELSELMEDCERWIDELPEQWRARKVRSRNDYPLEEITLHHDIWLAYMLNFHNASRICMQNAFLDVMTHRQDPQLDEYVRARTGTIADLSRSLLETMPQLLGLVDLQGQPRQSRWDLTGTKNGKGIGGFFAIYSLFAIRACGYTNEQHKQIAQALWEWIHKQNEQL